MTKIYRSEPAYIELKLSDHPDDKKPDARLCFDLTDILTGPLERQKANMVAFRLVHNPRELAERMKILLLN